MNRSEIFVFKPLSTGLGIERAHEVRYVPGIWSGTRARAAQVVKAAAASQTAKKSMAALATRANVPQSSLLAWQRGVAIWCDVLVCCAVAVFALICAGFFAACLDNMDQVNHLPATGPEIVRLITSFAWLRQSMQIVIAVTNLASSLPWLPVAGFAVLFVAYRLVVSLVSGASPGENLARWLAGA